MGRNMDIEAPVDYNIIYQPAGYVTATNLMGGDYPSRYRVLGLGFRNLDPLKDGINEHGLIGVTNEFFGSTLFAKGPQAGKINISSYHFLTYVLGNYASVAEIIEDADRFHLAKQGADGEPVISPGFHYMFTDASQESIVLEPSEGRLLVYDNPYGAMTNAPAFPKHIDRLQRLIDLDDLQHFNASKKLPGGYDPVSRFIRAYYMTAMAVDTETAGQALARCYQVLGAVGLPKGFIPNRNHQSLTFTTYSSAYVGQSGLLTVRTAANPQVYQVALSDFADQSDRQALFLPDGFAAMSMID